MCVIDWFVTLTNSSIGAIAGVPVLPPIVSSSAAASVALLFLPAIVARRTIKSMRRKPLIHSTDIRKLSTEKICMCTYYTLEQARRLSLLRTWGFLLPFCYSNGLPRHQTALQNHPEARSRASCLKKGKYKKLFSEQHNLHLVQVQP